MLCICAGNNRKLNEWPRKLCFYRENVDYFIHLMVFLFGWHNSCFNGHVLLESILEVNKREENTI